MGELAAKSWCSYHGHSPTLKCHQHLIIPKGRLIPGRRWQKGRLISAGPQQADEGSRVVTFSPKSGCPSGQTNGLDHCRPQLVGQRLQYSLFPAIDVNPKQVHAFETTPICPQNLLQASSPLSASAASASDASLLQDLPVGILGEAALRLSEMKASRTTRRPDRSKSLCA